MKEERQVIVNTSGPMNEVLQYECTLYSTRTDKGYFLILIPKGLDNALLFFVAPDEHLDVNARINIPTNPCTLLWLKRIGFTLMTPNTFTDYTGIELP